MPTFRLGAGFNVDATAEAGAIFGESVYGERYRIDCGYPLVGETLRLCFSLDMLPDGKSIEDLFADAIGCSDYDPLERLADRLREADYYIARRIARGEEANCYRRFFNTFANSDFLTFNYDSLPETFLYHLGRWYPQDGYGLPVAVVLPPGKDELADKKSSALVLHLHGSLCVSTSETEVRRKPGQSTPMLTPRDKPLFAFDASSISANFSPYQREPGSDDARDRVIAPIPDKSQGLSEAFVGGTYAKAEALVRESEIVVAIGYSFNHHDRASYQRLLCALHESSSRKLLVVSPDAYNVASALRPAFPSLSIEPLTTTFKKWVDASFPGLS
jgi:hypothetical protein